MTRPKRLFAALGDFGKASGNLAQTWLTPAQLELVRSAIEDATAAIKAATGGVAFAG